MSKYKKLQVDNKTLSVFLANSTKADDFAKLAHLKGIEIIDATPDEFLADYERRNGRVECFDK